MSSRYADLGNISSSTLKEALLLDALKYLKAGGDWKRAIEVCDQLIVFYRDVTANFNSLSAILVSLFEKFLEKYTYPDGLVHYLRFRVPLE